MYAPSPKNVTGALLRQALGLLVPAPCLACGARVDRPRRSLGLCVVCRGRLVPWPKGGCVHCGRELAAPARRCGGCRRRPPPYARLCCVFRYQPPLDAVLAGLKFRRLDYLGTQLGRALLTRLDEERVLHPAPDLVVPIPLHWRRRLARGYNQAALVAAPLARHYGVAVTEALRRRRPTPPQSRLPRTARLRNPHGAFVPRRGVCCAGRRVLLVDDVATTGATLAAAAICLRRAGAREVVAVAVARTPD